MACREFNGRNSSKNGDDNNTYHSPSSGQAAQPPKGRHIHPAQWQLDDSPQSNQE
ncbi:hypothetical protein ACRALDRAFT_2017804 [Sodiomyces alcalophilus JCM 7366]|uniref:uncharacterized protein n=1 Tax=Sodiomyces alcalophilus JCM 7366 TaxID=591952 RepID=UPI0039B51087